MFKTSIILILIIIPTVALARSEITGFISTDPSQPDKQVGSGSGVSSSPKDDNVLPNSTGGGSILIYMDQNGRNQTSNEDNLKVLGFDRLPDNTLVRDESKRIYIIKHGIKKVIWDLTELWQHKGKPILDLPDSELAQYPTRRFYSGELIRQVGSHKVFAITEGKKFHIRSLAELKRDYFRQEIFNVIREEFMMY